MTATDALSGRRETGNAYALAPMQEAMLFHSLCSPRSGFEIEQLLGYLPEELDALGFKNAWQRVMQRHAVLRTRFLWEDGVAPMQEVQEHLELSWAEHNWTELEPDEQERAWAAFLRADRSRGFRLDRAPLWRVTVFRLGPSVYRFVWTFHHALMDGRSFPIVLREVFQLTDAFARRQAVELPRPRPYQEHIRCLGQRDFAQAESFWRERLRGFTRPTPLRLSRPDSNPTGLRRGDKECQLPALLSAELERIADKNGFTLNTVIQGAWALLLSCATGEAEVLFGATRACRQSTVEGAISMVGLFINTLPMRVEVDPELEWLSWLKRLRAQWIELRPYEHTPLVKIRSWSDLPAEGPFFESIVVYDHLTLGEHMRRGSGPWLGREFQLLEQPASPVVLAASGGERLSLRILYDRSHIDDEMAERYLGHLRNILGAVAANPRLALAEIPLLTPEEQRHLVVEWNMPRLEFPPDACLHQLFEAQVKRTPDKLAVVLGGQGLTYAELNRRANQLAQTLRERKVGPETRVGLLFDRTPDLVVSILGVLKAGGAYVPMDHSWPADRLSCLLNDCKAPVVLTQRELAHSLSGVSAEVLCLDELSSEPGESADSNPNPESGATAQSLAYVIYTSGSTGRPKGVMVTHYNVVRLFQSTRQWFRFGRNDVWTLFHSPAFDFSTWELWGALLHGGKLVLVPHWITRSPEDFWKLLIEEKVTVLNQTPSAFRQLVQLQQTPAPPEPRPDMPAAERLACRWIIFGGEALEMASLKPWFERYGDQRPQLINMYGLTETTVHATYRPLRKRDLNGGSVIGVPLPDLQLYVLNERGEPAPIGMPGEIYIGGAGVARGYLDRPQLTAKRFIRSPFSEDPQARLYRTGDRGRLLPGRDVEYLGRIDNQIKIRGFRIEPAEIEMVLLQHPAACQAVVAVREVHPGDRRLVAYLVLDPPGTPLEEIRHLLKSRLPDYMLPAAMVVLDKMPLTTNGKIDRAALPAPGEEALPKAPVFAAPRPGLERVIAEIWQELLRVENVGVHDHFFEMGGHSLLLVQLHARLQTVLRRPVPITDLFQYPTISTLSRRLTDEPASASGRLEQRLRRVSALQET